MVSSVFRHAGPWPVVALVLVTSQATPSRQDPRLAHSVRAVWSTLDETWNARDAARFSDLFTADASFQFPDRGEGFEGRAAILASFAARFPTFAPDIRHRTTIGEVREITADVAAVDGIVEILRLRGADVGSAHVIRSFTIAGIMLRDGDTWRIRLLRALERGQGGSSEVASHARRGLHLVDVRVRVGDRHRPRHVTRDDGCEGRETERRSAVSDFVGHRKGLAVDDGPVLNSDDGGHGRSLDRPVIAHGQEEICRIGLDQTDALRHPELRDVQVEVARGQDVVHVARDEHVAHAVGRQDDRSGFGLADRRRACEEAGEVDIARGIERDAMA